MKVAKLTLWSVDLTSHETYHSITPEGPDLGVTPAPDILDTPIMEMT